MTTTLPERDGERFERSGRAMTGIVSWAVARGRMIVALILLTVTGGVAAYVGLPKEGEPNIDIPVLYISVALPGASAIDVERLVVRPIETKVQGLEGLKEMTGIASEGHAGVLLEFDFGWDRTRVIADVRALVDEAKAEMPTDAMEPTINEVNLSAFPILVVTLSGEAPQRTLQRLAKDLQKQIEALEPVLEVGLAGVREEMVEVIVDPLRLEAYNVTAQELLSVVAANNRLVAAGAVQSDAGRFSVRLPGAFQTLEDIYRTPVKVDGDRVVTIADLAEIRRTFEDAEGTARYNGEPTVALQVKKRAGANIIDTVALVRESVGAALSLWPAPLRASVEVGFSMDQSRQVKDMVSQLEGQVISAVVLVMLTVVLTLGGRSSLLVGLTIPCSFLLTFALLAVFDLSINNMTMFGLILAVGILVDGGIVVCEYADRLMSEGQPPEHAYAEASKRMFWPVISSTATILCAFLPLLLWPGLPGQFMGQLPVTLIFVLSASLIVALVFLPVLGEALGRAALAARHALRRIGLARPRAPTPPAPLGRNLFGRLMEPVVMTPLGPVLALAACLGAMVWIVDFYGRHNNGVEFFVDTEPERAIVYVRGRGNLSVSEKDRLVRAVEERVLGVEGVESVFAFAGDGGLADAGGDGPQDAIGEIQIELAPWGGRPDGDSILAEIARLGAEVPGVIVEVAEQAEGPEQGKPIQVRLESNDWDALLDAAADLFARLSRVDGLIDIEDTRPLPGIDWEITVDREAAGRFGADVQTTGLLVQLVTRGALLDTIRPDDSDEEIDIRVRFPEDARVLSTLENLKVRTEMGLVPIRNFIDIRPSPALAEITRFNGVRAITVKADVAPGVNANDKITEIAADLAANPLDGVRPVFQGDQEEQAESQRFLMVAFVAAIGLMFAILLAQFNSLYNTLLVLSAVVLSVAGVLVGMLVMNQPFSIIMTGTGVLALAGIVVSNNIILIDTYQDFAKRMPPLEAIVRTAEQRIRPVFLTTITTMIGLGPMMFAANLELSLIDDGIAAMLVSGGPVSGAGWRAFIDVAATVGAPAALWWTQLATAVFFGLGVATVLTLIVTPAALALRIWFWVGVSRIVAPLDLSRPARTLELERRARRESAPEIIWSDADADPLTRLPFPPRPLADAAE